MKPAWLNKKINLNTCSGMKESLRGLRVETVCEQAMCPNIGECFGRGEATFLILGKRCTRMCGFCNIEKGKPEPPDAEEPLRVAEAVARFHLKHVVITSVTRDDLSDGGAKLFADTVLNVRERSPGVTIEVLIPDFRLSAEALRLVSEAAPDIIAHNVETVPSLYPMARQGSDYRRSLEVLGFIKEFFPHRKTKSGIMLGLGEREDEVISVMKDLRSVKCDFLSIGQYLAPSRRHYPVKEYVEPRRFGLYKEKGECLGFLHVESAPYVRSSYRASEYLA
ncbi:MAG: lipoyl synthase [Candidatus Omnitrophica bacterium]|nr:lipoyl synthase [Candidatus Omnitrophota bacterium]MDD5436575.1 lipoyl synthase [Candidatus Omnitrophota bacterium]